MIKRIEDLFLEEEKILAPYAIRSSMNGGRIFPEKEHELRLPFQRDRDRIIHSRAFKRLEYKTQVFINSEGDNFRTRLTHTLEVAGISRTIATTLGLNVQLAESIALAHDLGHTPFGHAGQDKLSELMKSYGGFEHNKQSLRIVRKLENRYPGFVGLNLCRETLKGIMKHGGDYEESDLNSERSDDGPSLEAMLTDVADEIAYNSHDIEDGLEKNLISPEQLKEVQIWRRNIGEAEARFRDTPLILKLRFAIRSVLNEMVVDLLKTTDSNLERHKVKDIRSLHSVWRTGIRLAVFSDSMQEDVSELKKFLTENLYRHPDVLAMSQKGQEIIEKLFHYFIGHPEIIPDSYRQRIEEEGKFRVICDYIAGMTDRYAEQLFSGI